MVPAMIILFGFMPEKAVGTSLLAIVFISVASALMHLRCKFPKLKRGIILGISGSIGVQLGVLILKGVPARIFTVLFSIVLLYVAFIMFDKSFKTKKYFNKEGRPKESQRQPSDNILFFSVFGFIAGVLSSFFGIGGGILMVPIMTLAIGYKNEVAVGTSTLAIVIISSAGAITHSMLGNIDSNLGLILGLSGVIGAFIGTAFLNIIKYLEDKKNVNVRWIFYSSFGLLLFVTIIRMLIM